MLFKRMFWTNRKLSHSIHSWDVNQDMTNYGYTGPRSKMLAISGGEGIPHPKPYQRHACNLNHQNHLFPKGLPHQRPSMISEESWPQFRSVSCWADISRAFFFFLSECRYHPPYFTALRKVWHFPDPHP